MEAVINLLRNVLVWALVLLYNNGAICQQTLRGAIQTVKGEPLPYTAILVKNSGKGFLSNEEGQFIVNTGEADTLIFRRVGYKPLFVTTSHLQSHPIVSMEIDVTQIDEVTIEPGDKHLYDEILACRAALFTQPLQKSKAYYLLEGEANGKPTEMLECYYNSTYSARRVESLVFKNGRAALAPVNNKFFVSIDFSKAFAMNDLVVVDQRLPVSPLHLSPVQLRKQYELTLAGYEGLRGEVIHIICKPKSRKDRHYSGELWIHSGTHLPLKIVLEIPATQRHPLKSLQYNRGEIRDAGIRFEKVFVIHEGRHILKNTLLRYNYTFIPKKSKSEISDITLKVRSTALIHFFDHDELFIAPYFRYDEGLDDYRMISGLSYNENFWNYNNSFFQSRSMQEKIKYFKHHGYLLNYSKRKTIEDETWDGYLFKSSLIMWQKNRRLAVKKGTVVTDTSRSVEYKARKTDHLFDLDAQIYLDVNLVNGTLSWYTATIFDANMSYYDLPADQNVKCFINIYFDLFEIARRRLEKKLAECHNCSIQQIDSIYKLNKQAIAEEASSYLLRCNRGYDLGELQRWNEKVIKELQIDNMGLFGLSDENK